LIWLILSCGCRASTWLLGLVLLLGVLFPLLLRRRLGCVGLIRRRCTSSLLLLLLVLLLILFLRLVSLNLCLLRLLLLLLSVLLPRILVTVPIPKASMLLNRRSWRVSLILLGIIASHCILPRHRLLLLIGLMMLDIRRRRVNTIPYHLLWLTFNAVVTSCTTRCPHPT
jgi:hypothetical protein